MSNKIIYLASLGSVGSVNAIHIYNRAKLFSALGYCVSVISDLPYDGYEHSSDNLLTCYYLKRYNGNRKFWGVHWWKEQMIGYDTFTQAKKIILEHKPNFVILYEPNSYIIVELLRKLSVDHEFKLVLEISEWMESKDYRFPAKILIMQKDFQRRHLDKKVHNIIAISNFLAKHYHEQNCNTVFIPPLFDILLDEKDIAIHKHPKCSPKLRLVFSGSLGHKDYLLPLIEVVTRENISEIKIAFDIIGPSRDSVIGAFGICDLEKIGIFLHGRMTHDQAISIVREADFSILLRENRRYARAGVSTKFVEALSFGVPSICTKVGGTDLFVNDGINGFLVSENSFSELNSIIGRILAMETEDILQIKRNALSTAKQLFSSEQYFVQTKQFLKESK